MAAATTRRHAVTVLAVSGYQTIAVEQSGPVARITLNRPDAANGMNAALTAELADAAAALDRPDVKVVVVTGAGRFFCAGGDLKDAVVITAVNGTAAGAGFSLAVTGDLVLAAESASFTMAYTRVGLSPDGSSSYYLPRLIGVARTKQLMLTNRTLSAQEALSWGLLTEVVADDHLAARADELAEQMAATAAGSNGGVKALLLGSFASGLEEQMELEGRLIAARAETAEGREGVDAFLAKRTPEF